MRTKGVYFWFLILSGALAFLACATNPATGRQQLSLIGQQQEIAMGREADKEVRAQIGLYSDPKAEALVTRIGQRLASKSERPDLPWTFRIVDDPAVNAFALPGGFIYVTRGILAYLDSEAELAAVLGHEIGHVTARHSVSRLSKQELLSLGLGLGVAVKPELARYADLAEQGLGLLFLKFSRNDERQADELGLRYLVRGGYKPQEMVRVFELLDRVSTEESAGARVPQWLATHPTPANREKDIAARIARLAPGSRGGVVGRKTYLDAIDGIVFGDDPRQGYFRGSTFIHPQLRFAFDFPSAWKHDNQRRQVLAIAPDGDAVVAISLAKGGAAEAAAHDFFAQQSVTLVRSSHRALDGLNAVGGEFEAKTEQGDFSGRVEFIAYGPRLYRLLALASATVWKREARSLTRSIASFRRVSERSLLDVEPARIALVDARTAMSLADFEKRYPSTVSLKRVALVNQLAPGQSLRVGELYKRVVGGISAPK